MPDWVTELIVIFALILLNGVLSMAEIAIVVARKNRLDQRARDGDPRARSALGLKENSTLFLSTVQIGITLIGVITSVFGGARIAGNLSAWLSGFPVLAPYSEAISLGLIVVIITYFTLVLGELAPKQIGLMHPESISLRLAGVMLALSRIFSPLVRLLSASTGALLRLFRIKPSSEPPVTEDEVKAMIQEGTQAGVFEESEQDMVAGIFRLSDLRVGQLMTPRSEIVWLDLEDSLEMNSLKILESKYGRFPVGRGGLDDWVGIVQSKDLLNQALKGEPVDLEARLIQPLVVPESMLALKVMDMFQDSGIHIALVIDEFGVLQGMVTIFDILEAIVGDIPVLGEPVEAGAIQREDGTWLLDGMLTVDDFKEIFRLGSLPDEARGYFQTLAGFVINYLGRIPSAGEQFDWSNLHFEIVDMDGLRVDKILVSPEPGDNNLPGAVYGRTDRGER